MITIAQEQPDDHWEVENLYDLCFAPGREALSSYRLREGVAPVAELCLTARDADGILAGAIRFWPIRIRNPEGGTCPALLLGPIAVHPTHQGEGLGGGLIHAAHARIDKAGPTRILLVGDVPYYGRFGYGRINGVEMPPPTNPDRVLGRGDWQAIMGQVCPASDL